MSNPDPTPQPPSLPTTAEIFRQALAQNAAIHQRALDEMQRHTDEVHTQLRALTQQRVQAMQLSEFPLVLRATQLEDGFWDEIVNRAIVVLKQHGEFPAEQEHDNGHQEAEAEGA